MPARLPQSAGRRFLCPQLLKIFCGILPSPVYSRVWLGLHLLIIAVLPLLFSRLPAGVQTQVYGTTTSDSPLRSELLELGFPEDILSRLDDSELARFEGAYQRSWGRTRILLSVLYPQWRPGKPVARYELRNGFRPVRNHAEPPLGAHRIQRLSILRADQRGKHSKTPYCPEREANPLRGAGGGL